MVQEYMKLLLVSFLSMCYNQSAKCEDFEHEQHKDHLYSEQRWSFFAPVATPSVWVSGQLANRRLSRPTNEKLAQ